MTTDPVFQLFTTLGNLLFTVAFIKVTLVLGVTAVVTTLARNRSAAFRALVWGVSFLGIIALPLVSALLPEWDLANIGFGRQVTELAASSPTNTLFESTVISSTPLQVTTSNTTIPSSPLFAALVVAIAVWFAVGLLLCVRVVMSNMQVMRLVARAKPASAQIIDRTSALAHGLGLRRMPRVVVSCEVDVPGSFGLRRSVILLPMSVDTWTDDQLSAVLAHECGHIVRNDYGLHVVAQIARALYWVNPLVHLAYNRLSVERERACDDVAIRSGIRNDRYAGHLLSVARMGLATAEVSGTLAMARASGLKERVKSIMRASMDRSPLRSRSVAVAVVGTVVLLLPVAAVQILSQTAPTVQELVDRLRSENPMQQRRAAWRLGEMEAGDGAQPLLEALRSTDPLLRTVAAWALGEIKDPLAVDGLTQSLDDDDRFVREMAALALGELERPTIVRALVSAAERHTDLQQPVVWALGEIPSDEASAERARVVEGIDQDSQENDEVWAGRMDGAGTFDAGRDLDQVLALLNSSSADERVNAAFHLGVVGDVRGVDALLGMLRDPEARVRAMAVWALDEINPSRD